MKVKNTTPEYLKNIDERESFVDNFIKKGDRNEK